MPWDRVKEWLGDTAAHARDYEIVRRHIQSEMHCDQFEAWQAAVKGGEGEGSTGSGDVAGGGRA
eukprot:3033459-Prymnesium_polylepis.1